MTDYPKASITGVILSGGRARRMGGQDKGLLSLAGRPLVAYAIQGLRPQVESLIINANRHLDIYENLGHPVVEDAVSGFLGPLVGMLTAMEASNKSYLLTMPCDSPLLPTDYAQLMYTALLRDPAELAVAHDGNRLQPVFTLLKTELQHSMRNYLEQGGRKIDAWFAQHKMALADFSHHPEMFRNINTPEELTLLEDQINRTHHNSEIQSQ